MCHIYDDSPINIGVFNNSLRQFNPTIWSHCFAFTAPRYQNVNRVLKTRLPSTGAHSRKVITKAQRMLHLAEPRRHAEHELE